MDLNKIIGKFLGNKADRDMKDIGPLVDKIEELYETFHTLSNDELRERSNVLRKKIQSYVDEERKELATLKEQAEDPEVDVNLKEEMYNKIDKLETAIDDKFEVILKESIPEAFSIIRETASHLSLFREKLDK